MIGVDTNILIYAHRSDSPWHAAALQSLSRLAESGRAWAIPWPCIHEFLAISTHPRIFSPPTPMRDAILAVESWMQAPTLRLLGETEGYFGLLQQLLEHAHVQGPVVHDARIAALCLQHGVSELWTADRDFGRFRGLRVHNPLPGADER